MYPPWRNKLTLISTKCFINIIEKHAINWLVTVIIYVNNVYGLLIKIYQYTSILNIINIFY